MCKICTKAKGLDPKAALALIGNAMAKGAAGEHFEKVLDEILGTKTPEQDEELNAAWEASHRIKS